MAHLFDVTNIPDDIKKDREFGIYLRDLRVRAGFSVQYVHVQTKIPHHRILSLETGHAYPSIFPRELRAIARIYRIDLRVMIALLK